MAVVATLLVSCGGSTGGPDQPPPPEPVSACPDRGELCADDLLTGTSTKLVAHEFFMPPPDAQPALHELSGTLNVTPTFLETSPADVDDRLRLPGFSVQWLSVADQILPLERDIIIGGGGNRWSLILSPGKSWSEPGDQGMSRASFPFTLVTEQWNEAHNGVATFLFDDAEVSDLRLQVAQETALWNKIDISARAPATYSPHSITDAAMIEAAYRQELAQRIEVRSWKELEDLATVEGLSELSRNVPIRDVSTAGVVVDYVLYLRGANSRMGAYPYPLEMRHGVFSVTKSSAAALTLLRLAQKYGAYVFDLNVTDYVSVTAPHSGWNGVTFGHLLSMVAGIGDQAPNASVDNTFADENDEDSNVWFRTWNTFDRQGKLEQAFRYGNYPWGPGEIVRYNTAHTYILGEAMDRFYKAMEGANADVWQMMKDEVYAPIGINVVPMIKTIGSDALPIFGFGLFLNAYDTARIMQLFQNDGAWNGEQLLHRDLTRMSLYKDGHEGYATASVTPIPGEGFQTIHYLNSFWSFTLTDDTCTVRVPYMWGYGGNFVAILPNGTGAFLYADANVHEPGGVATAAASVRPLCDQ